MPKDLRSELVSDLVFHATGIRNAPAHLPEQLEAMNIGNLFDDWQNGDAAISVEEFANTVRDLFPAFPIGAWLSHWDLADGNKAVAQVVREAKENNDAG